MDRLQAQNGLLVSSLVLCAVLFVGVCVSVLNTQPDGFADSLSMETLERIPAALPIPFETASQPEKEKAPEFGVWKLPCLGKTSKTFETESKWLRLTSRSCSLSEEIVRTHLINQTNGFEATLFSTSPRQITSDFIPLEPGANLLSFEVEFASGEKHGTTLNVQRNSL